MIATVDYEMPTAIIDNHYDDLDVHIYDNESMQNSSQDHVRSATATGKGRWRTVIYICGLVITSCASAVTGYYTGLIFMTTDQTSCATEIQWNKCSVECGNGTQYGIKIDREDMNGKCVITSNRSIERSCDNDDACPVDGGWGPWKLFGSCSVTCGTGLVPIVRTCDNPVPSNNGKYYVGEHYSLGTCIKEQYADENLAENKESEQSSTYSSSGVMRNSSFAVDGLINVTDHFNCIHTNRESKAWWAVDLKDLYDIHRVVIYGRTDCCTKRLSNFDIDIFKSRNTRKLEFSNFQDGIRSKCHYQSGEVPNHVLNATCPPGIYGQFVRVQLRGSNYLTLCEVEVYGTSRLIEYSDFEFESPYSGPKVTIVNNATEEQCDTFCDKDSNGFDCNASYSRQSNTCTVRENSTTSI